MLDANNPVLILQTPRELGTVAHWEVDARRSQVQSFLWLHNKLKASLTTGDFDSKAKHLLETVTECFKVTDH